MDIKIIFSSFMHIYKKQTEVFVNLFFYETTLYKNIFLFSSKKNIGLKKIFLLLGKYIFYVKVCFKRNINIMSHIIYTYIFVF